MASNSNTVQGFMNSLFELNGRPSPYSEDTENIKTIATSRNPLTGCLLNFSYENMTKAVNEIKDFYNNSREEIEQVISKLNDIETRIVPVSESEEDDPFI